MKRGMPICLTAFLLSQWALAERPVTEIPMYGGQHDPSVERNPAHSQDAVQRGWEAYYEDDLDTAMKQFNQAWILDRENSEAYWGFGLIMGRRASREDPEANLKESIRFLQMAGERDPKNGRIMGDLAFSHTILGYYYQSKRKKGNRAKTHFKAAGKLFENAYHADPDYPPILANWSVFFFYTGDYQQAKSKADTAQQLGYVFSPAYIKDLEKHMK
jgi:tetratricopeptide (TPR) repeat protein